MKAYLFPDEYRNSIWEIDYTGLLQKGIRGIILDIDNTLLPYYVPEPDEKLVQHIQGLMQQGFKLYIVSNGREERVQKFNARLGLPFICRAGKPGKKGFEQAMKMMKLAAHEIAVIGDQIFTDVWGGRKMDMYTIMVKQVSRKDEWITAVKRPLEKIVLFFYRRQKRRRLKND